MQLFYKDLGPKDAQPIVHHGWPLSADDWDAQLVFFLAHGYRVIVHDRRGHGRSSKTDWWGLAYAMLSFAMPYARMDQGNRLDWRGNGLVVGLLAGGGALSAAFIGRELIASSPFLNLRLLLRGNLALLMLILAGFRFIILSTGYIIPTYLQAIQNFRELQVGQVLLWIAVPQLALVVPVAVLLRRMDGRCVLAAGTVMICVACLMAVGLTSIWATDDFLPCPPWVVTIAEVGSSN